MIAGMDDIEQRWTGWDSLLVGLGQALRELLLERCGREWLLAHEAYLCSKDAPLQKHYVECWLTVNQQHYYLRNIGYTECPHWLVQGRDASGFWFHVHLTDRDLRQELEMIFGERPGPANAVMRECCERCSGRR